MEIVHESKYTIIGNKFEQFGPEWFERITAWKFNHHLEFYVFILENFYVESYRRYSLDIFLTIILQSVWKFKRIFARELT